MRIIAVIILAAVMYFGVPYLWQRAMIAQVNKISADGSNLPEMNASLTSNLTFDQNVINSVNPAVTINSAEYEGIAVRSQTDDAMRQAQAAQDQAWKATH